MPRYRGGSGCMLQFVSRSSPSTLRPSATVFPSVWFLSRLLRLRLGILEILKRLPSFAEFLLALGLPALVWVVLASKGAEGFLDLTGAGSGLKPEDLV
mmetsp:Transcript_4512/g.9055  ORF Transcript_4512/g.9055 Transcript_4512/m.9055 type:complete len:98 (-) Transcript_4512:908-1201(-)